MAKRAKTKDEVLKILGEPILCELSEKAWRIRTTLFSVSVVALALVFFDLRISADSSVLGIKFSGLNDRVIAYALLLVVSYLLIHFLWASADTFLEWRLRITGTRVSPVTVAVVGSDEGDYPSDPRQSTLYNWWKAQASKIGNMGALLHELHASHIEWEKRLRAVAAEAGNHQNLVTVLEHNTRLHEAFAELRRRFEATEEAFKSNRIPASLERFDGWFAIFNQSQNWRWLLIDFLTPVVLGAAAILVLSTRT